MAKGINKVILVGHLGRDPEVRYTPSGGAVANITLATSDAWKDKHSGQSQERTEWHKIVFFNRLAEIVEQYLKKGALIYVEGRLQTRKWQDQSGNDRYTTEIVANEMQMLSDRSSTSKAPADPSGPSSVPSGATGSAPVGNQDFDDDIPF